MSDSALLRALKYEAEPDGHFFRRLVRNLSDSNNISVLGRALFIAVERNFVDSTRILLDAGVSPNTMGRRNGTPLHICSADKQGVAIVRVLLQYGADVNAVDGDNGTPLHHAIFYGCAETVQELLKNGARVDTMTVEGLTPLILSILFFENLSTIKALLRAGADVNLKNGRGRAPLHYAVERHLPQVVRLLLQHNADSNVRDMDGYTPLHRTLFATQKAKELIRDLVKGGARLNALSNDGHSPLYCSVYYSNEESAKELLRCGAPFDIRECLETLVDAAVKRRLPNTTTIARELLIYLFIQNPDSLESIRQLLKLERVGFLLRTLSSPTCNLESFKNACLSEVEALSNTSCDCGKSSVWTSFNNFEEGCCDSHLAILKFLSSGQYANFTDVFFHKLSKKFLLEVSLNLVSYFGFKESKKRVLLIGDCVEEIEPYVSLEDVPSYLQKKLKEMGVDEFEKFLVYVKRG